MLRFNSEFKAFRVRSEKIGQKGALEASEFLIKLYNQKAEEFVKENGIRDIVKYYISELLYATTFSQVNEINAFILMLFSPPIFTPTYKFEFQFGDMLSGMSDHMREETVEDVLVDEQIVTTNGNTYKAENIVIATPPNVSKKLLKLDEINTGVYVHMFHVSGHIRDRYEVGEEELFSTGAKVIVISDEDNQTYLLYSKVEDPDFEKYFKDFTIIRHKYWNPAFHIGNILLDSDINENVTLIGDNNMPGLEDSYISGIYAATRILNKVK